MKYGSGSGKFQHSQWQRGVKGVKISSQSRKNKNKTGGEQDVRGEGNGETSPNTYCM
jgi:hypothetical protein